MLWIDRRIKILTKPIDGKEDEATLQPKFKGAPSNFNFYNKNMYLLFSESALPNLANFLPYWLNYVQELPEM